MTAISPEVHGPRHRARPSWRQRAKRAAAALGVAGLVAGASVVVIEAVLPADRAYAAVQYGPGLDFGFGHVGGFRMNDGSIAYCLNSSAAPPIGVDPSPWTSTQYASLSANQTAGISWAIATYGQTNDDTQASIVARAIWVALGQETSSNSSVNSLASQILSYVAAPVTSTGSVSMMFDVDPTNNYTGTLRIVSMTTTPASGTINLTNGIFGASGTSSLTGTFSAGQSLDVVGVPPAPGADYKISASASLTASTPGGYQGLTVWSAGAYQELGTPRTGSGSMSLTGVAIDPSDRTSAFYPEVGTTVSTTRIEAGDRFADVLAFSLGANDEGVTNQWPQRLDGTYYPLVADCTVYGPFTQQPSTSTDAPVGAPAASSFTVTTGDAGPTVTYPVVSDDPLTAPGFYTAQCSIDIARQGVIEAYMAPEYHFQDSFGLAAETAVVPVSVDLGTELLAPEIGFGHTVSDDVTVSLTSGDWLSDVDGNPVSVTLTGRSYFVDAAPVQAATPPAAAVLVETITLEVDGEGTVTSDPFTAPYQDGYLVVQWCIEGSEFVVNTCDDWGVPSETARVAPPSLTTAAQASSGPFATVHDVATVSGKIPAGGLSVSFAGYLQPGDAEEPICEPENLVFASAEPILITEEGDYPSEHFTTLPEHVGTVYWIETATAPGGGDVVVAEGECGLLNETSVISWPTLTTKATERVAPGGVALDVATLGGTLPSAGFDTSVLVQFDAYWTDSDQPVCEPANRVHHEVTRIDLGEVQSTYSSSAVSAASVRPGHIWFVATLTYVDEISGEETAVAIGECGDLDEVTTVDPLLAQTGRPLLSGVIWIAGGALGAGVLALLIARIMRRSRNG